MLLTVLVEIQTWQWIEETDLYDCVAGISYKGSPVGIGVFFDVGLLLTSANPLEPYLEHDLHDIRVHAVTGAFNSSTEFEVVCASTPYKIDRRALWVSIGTDGRHSAIHDVLVLNIKSDQYHLAPELQFAFNRHAFSAHFAQPKDELSISDYHIPGFGYMDKAHIKNMTNLEVDVLKENNYTVDCYDYFPWEWGRFICLKNIKNIVGVQSGAPLLHNNLIYGIASFTVDLSEDEQIVAFTDIRDYVYNFHYCTDDTEEFVKWWSVYWNDAVSTIRPDFPLDESLEKLNITFDEN